MKNNSKSANLVIVTAIPFPIGLAGTNRIMSYSRGLVELGDKVTVLTTHFGDDSSSTGNHSGVDYRSFSGWFGQKRFMILSIISSIFQLCKYINKKKSQIDYILIVSNSFFFILAMYALSKITGLKYLQEKSEFPFVLNRTSIFGKVYAKIYVSIVYHLFDGMIIMTYPLMAYFEDKTKRQCKKILLPMTVEADRFQRQKSKNLFGDYIAYCGYMGGNKDGVENLIKAFDITQSSFPKLKLVLIGTAPQYELDKLREIVKMAKIENVIFHGYASRNEMPQLLSHAKILALARPSSLQSTGGFPTKLGEYLATGRPVVVTAVGDIPRYLTDGKDAFIVQPDDNNEFAKKLQLVMNNYQQALKIGQKGRLLASGVFNYRYQSKRLHKYLIKLLVS
jgi:glycosyltransferase involved in cell wall biosynthesis